MPTDPALRARLTGVGLAYGSGVRALEQVDLELRAGRVTALVGANGSGKSSLARVLAGRVHPEDGEVIVVDQQSPARLRGRARRRLLRALAYLSQETEIDPEMGVLETLELLAILHGVRRADRRARVDRVLDDLQLSGHRDMRAGELSGGLRRRLHLAGVLLQQPELLVLDEPDAGLDQQGRDALWQGLQRTAAAGAAVAVATHDFASVESCADEVLVMDGGRMVLRGTPAEIAGEQTSLAAGLRSRVEGDWSSERTSPGRPGRGRGRRGRRA